MQEQLERREKLVTAIPALEKEIADIRYLWRLISIPGTKVESSSTKPDNGVAITVDSGKTKFDKDDKVLYDRIDGAAVDGDDNGDEKEEVLLNHCGLRLIIPKSLRRKAEETDKAPATDFLLSLKKEAEKSDITPVTGTLQSSKRGAGESGEALSSVYPMAQRTEAEKSDLKPSHVIPMASKRKTEESDKAPCIVSPKLLKSEAEESYISSDTDEPNDQSPCVGVPAKVNGEIIPSFEIIDSAAKRPEVTHNLNNRLKELLLGKITSGNLHRDKTKVEDRPDRKETNSATNTYTFVIEASSGKYKTISHNVPTVVTNDLDENDAKREKSRDGCESAWSETSGMKLRTLVSAGLSENMELEEMSSVDNFGYNFRSADENAPHSLSSSQSSNSQDTEYEGYEEMKPGEPIELSAYDLANDVDASDSDSDVEVIELKERKLIIDLTD